MFHRHSPRHFLATGAPCLIAAAMWLAGLPAAPEAPAMPGAIAAPDAARVARPLARRSMEKRAVSSEAPITPVAKRAPADLTGAVTAPNIYESLPHDSPHAPAPAAAASAANAPVQPPHSRMTLRVVCDLSEPAFSVAEELQACIDRAPVGASVEIPRGIYLIHRQIVVTRPVTLRTELSTSLTRRSGTTGSSTTRMSD